MSIDLRKLAGFASAGLVLFGALAAAAQPQLVRKVARWAEEDRYVAAESGSSRAGKWMNSTSPLAVEIMDCLDADHPARRVVLAIAAQLFKSEIALNWMGQTINDDPASMMLVVPSLDELRNWNNTKWQPTLDASRANGKPWKVFDVVDRSKAGSTTSFKRFRGGFLVATTANSSKGLQGRSIKRLVCDEVSEFPTEVGGRGDPIRQAETRGDAHEDFKALHISTRKELPGCRITAMCEAGDMRVPYVQCPHCDVWQTLEFENMEPAEKNGGRAAFRCVSGNGCVIDEIHKPEMLDNAVWLKTYPSTDPENPAPPEYFDPDELETWRGRGAEGRDPSFSAWQAYSKLKSWTKIWQQYKEALADVESGRDPEALKVFWQQVLNRAWDPVSDAPDHKKLFEARGRFVTRGVVPGWACELVCTADIQGDRIEWDAYAMGPDLSMARFDWGVIEVDPLREEAWAQLALVFARRYDGENTIELGFDVCGVDSGGKKGVTERVYRFVRGRPNVVALKGSKDKEAVPLLKGKRSVIRLEGGGSVTGQPYLVGGWGLKAAIYSMLQTTLQAEAGERLPGGLYDPIDATEEDFKQYTAEVFVKPRTMRSGVLGDWNRIAGRANERLDTAHYARALFWWRGAFKRTPEEWRALFDMRAKTPEALLPLFAAVDMPRVAVAPELVPNPGGKPRSSLFSGRTQI